jgi:hypothetical protein
MSFVLKKPEESPEYTVATGDTLTSIAAAQCADLGDKGPEMIAMLNWGSSEPAEIARAMAETVGVKLSDAPDLGAVTAPYTLAFTRAGVPGKIRIPQKYTASGLAYEKTHQVKVRSPKPANVVELSKLDRWFIPESETCRIGWRTEGLAATAGKLSLDVYGSDYCACTDWNKNFGTFGDPAALIDMPIWTKADLAATERTAAAFEWDGSSSAADGALKPDAADVPRHVNVAFSPYTVQMRYWQADGDKDARVVLKPFWPAWKPDATRDSATFKIEWSFVKTGGKLKRGLLTVVDKTDKPVWRTALPEAKLADGDQHEIWVNGAYADGVTNSEGGAEAIPEDMPYRVRLEAHKNANEAEGLALAAMHSEVRLYVHHETHARDLDPYVCDTDKTSLTLSLADLNHKDAVLTRAADGDMWMREQLAKAGWHAGPLSDKAPGDPLKRALADFQRSAPKHRPGGTGDYARQTVVNTGAADADAKDALEHIDPRYKRPWFGKADATRDDYANDADALKADLRDPAKEVIVWVDDRYWYTDPFATPNPSGHAPTLQNFLLNHGAAPKPARGTLTVGDGKVDFDIRDTERPWLPLQIQPALLGRDEQLDAVKDVGAIGDDLADKMRRAIGPIRVDWSFDEIDGDTIVVPEVDTTLYGASSRTKPALEWSLNRDRVEHDRKDVKRHAKYFNAPKAAGGTRPNGDGSGGGSAAAYYKEAFGVGEDNSLWPWRSADDPTREVIATVVHDPLGASHAATDRFAKRRGRAGVYFTPSIMAGDGYRVRAQVRFEKTAGYDFPNAAALDKRYPKLPQAQSAKMRVWRKASMRAYLQWASASSFGTAWGELAKHYAIAHVHLINEAGISNGDLLRRPSNIFPTAADADYLALVRRGVPNPSSKRTAAWVRVYDDFAWPWYKHKHLGLKKAIFNSVDPYADAYKLYNDNMADAWYPYALNLTVIVADWLEKKHGLMRGHILTEFKTTDKVWFMQYDCQTCNTANLFLERENLASESTKNACLSGGCGGKLLNRPTYVGNYKCANGHTSKKYEDGLAGGKYAGDACNTCASTYAADTADAVEYKCSACTFVGKMVESGTGGDHVNQACKRDDCAGTLMPTGAFVKEDYTCSACAQTVKLMNAVGLTGSTHDGTAHAGCPGAPPPPPPAVAPPVVAGTLTGTGAFVQDYATNNLIANKNKVEVWAPALRERMDGIPSSALGLMGGMNVNFHASVYEKYRCSACAKEVTLREDGIAGGKHMGATHETCTSTPKGTYGRLGKIVDTGGRLWAHETGHNRYLQHSSNAPGAQAAQHDSAPNAAQAGAAEATGKNWDRACLMSYSSHYTDFDMEADLTCMCYRCVLKNRGWKLGSTALPPSVIP